jgi:hypothetical protein
LAFKRAAGLAVDDDSIRVAETSTLHYAVRLTIRAWNRHRASCKRACRMRTRSFIRR